MSSEQATDEATRAAIYQVDALRKAVLAANVNKKVSEDGLVRMMYTIQLARIANALESLDVTLKAGTHKQS